MIGNLKLKVRGGREEPLPNRRIKTETNENSKKISCYLNKSKVPLAENKKNTNENDTLSLKRQKPVKTISIKPNSSSKINTDVKDNDRITNAHRQAMEKIFGAASKK
jgi:hypothetical protein